MVTGMAFIPRFSSTRVLCLPSLNPIRPPAVTCTLATSMTAFSARNFSNRANRLSGLAVDKSFGIYPGAIDHPASRSSALIRTISSPNCRRNRELASTNDRILMNFRSPIVGTSSTTKSTIGRLRLRPGPQAKLVALLIIRQVDVTHAPHERPGDHAGGYQVVVLYQRELRALADHVE